MGRPNELSVSALSKKISERSISSTEIVESCLARIAERDGTVGAWQYLDPDQALAQAAERDTTPSRSPLHGIPVGLKDVIETADMPTTYGSPIYQDHMPSEDALITQRLRAAGAVILGKTVSTQFAHRTPGKTANPRNPAHTPGGSSSGSAAATADLMTPLAFGTQTAGSVIRPAAYCGVIGFKPSFGWTNFNGVKNLSASLDTLGYYVRSLDDLPLVHRVLNATLLPGPAEDGSLHAAPRILVCRTPAWNEASPAGKAILEETADRLAAAGATVHDLDLEPIFADVFDAHTTVMSYEMAHHLAAERRDHWAMISPPTQSYIEAGEACSQETITAARLVLEQARERLSRCVDLTDVILTPSAPGEAPAGLASTGDAVFNRMWTSLHVPCLHLPIRNGPQDLPLGITLAARTGAEERLVATARWAAQRLDLPLFG
ncbi:MAG: amidase [Alphaproteobacteria bacterium]|nr:amidase [Alphaproteobacteria bacterium]